MKFRLKSLFAITLIVASIVACISNNRRALREVHRLKEIVDATLREIDGLKSDSIKRSEFRNEFVLFSSGTVNWNIDPDGQEAAKIQLAWRSRLLFPENPSITLTHRDTPGGNWFAQEYARIIQDHAIDMTVIKDGG